MRGCLIVCFVFFFKQKTAYEMRISDWSSDVCSSDLDGRGNIVDGNASATNDRSTAENIVGGPDDFARCSQIVQPLARALHEGQQIDGQELVADDPVFAQQCRPGERTGARQPRASGLDRKSTRLNSSP